MSSLARPVACALRTLSTLSASARPHAFSHCSTARQVCGVPVTNERDRVGRHGLLPTLALPQHRPSDSSTNLACPGASGQSTSAGGRMATGPPESCSWRRRRRGIRGCPAHLRGAGIGQHWRARPRSSSDSAVEVMTVSAPMKPQPWSQQSGPSRSADSSAPSAARAGAGEAVAFGRAKSSEAGQRPACSNRSDDNPSGSGRPARACTPRLPNAVPVTPMWLCRRFLRESFRRDFGVVLRRAAG